MNNSENGWQCKLLSDFFHLLRGDPQKIGRFMEMNNLSEKKDHAVYFPYFPNLKYLVRRAAEE